MHLEETDSLATLTFEHYSEALDYAYEHRADAPNADTDGANRMQGRKQLDTNVVEFTGTKDYETAHKLATSGWLLGSSHVMSFKEKLDVTGEIEQPQVCYDVYGDGGVDMGRFMTGEPECMLDFRMSDNVQRSFKQVKICVNISMAAGVDETTVSRRGAAIIALVDALESAGVRVELEAVKINASWGGKSICIHMPLKRADESLQLDSIAFALCHRASNRRIGFSLTHMCGQIGRTISSEGYGSESSYRPTCDIFTGRLNSGSMFDSDAKAIAWIKEELVKFGVKLLD